MSKAAEISLAIAAALLLAVIGVETLWPGQNGNAESGDQTGVVAVPRLRLLPHAGATTSSFDAAAIDAIHIDAWAASIIARPLFARNRRPPNEAVASEAVAQPLPRLTGVAVSPLGRSAIFAGPDGGKPVVVSMGGQIGVYTVAGIEPGTVTLSGPDGSRTLNPAFDAARHFDPPQATAQAADPANPGPPGFAPPGLGAPGLSSPGLSSPGLSQPGVAPPGLPGNPLNNLLGTMPAMGRPRMTVNGRPAGGVPPPPPDLPQP